MQSHSEAFVSIRIEIKRIQAYSYAFAGIPFASNQIAFESNKCHFNAFAGSRMYFYELFSRTPYKRLLEFSTARN